MFRRRTPDHVTIPAEGDLISAEIPVEAIRAYSVGNVWFARDGVVVETPKDDGRRVRVAEVLIDGVWQPL